MLAISSEEELSRQAMGEAVTMRTTNLRNPGGEERRRRRNSPFLGSLLPGFLRDSRRGAQARPNVLSRFGELLTRSTGGALRTAVGTSVLGLSPGRKPMAV